MNIEALYLHSDQEILTCIQCGIEIAYNQWSGDKYQYKDEEYIRLLNI